MTKCGVCGNCLALPFLQKRKTYICGSDVDQKCGFDHLFFYCDVQVLRTVGNAQAPLLAVLPNKSEVIGGSVVTRIFQNVRYGN